MFLMETVSDFYQSIQLFKPNDFVFIHKGYFVPKKHRSKNILNRFKLPQNQKQHAQLQQHVIKLIRNNKAATIGNYLLGLDNRFIKKTKNVLNQLQAGGMEVVNNVLKRKRPMSHDSSRK